MSKRAIRWSPPPADTRSPRRDTGVLAASSEGEAAGTLTRRTIYISGSGYFMSGFCSKSCSVIFRTVWYELILVRSYAALESAQPKANTSSL
ncbi:hypothetical protein EVAR_11099_1 [Eumeta japonica]|uniref:Uncharacterized protein n=1 Tax=Eumeta variegata TaxID=151549 RepID=A0A4C1U479_EUMVA|nr:hypothetical protein EVAR_11099_1 [Eumeta japonica]